MTRGWRMALRPAPQGWQVDAIAGLLEQLPGASERKVGRWATLIWIAGHTMQPDWGKAARDVERLSKALRVCPTAQICLLFAPEGQVDVMAIAKIVDAAAERFRRAATDSRRPQADVNKLLAEAIALAYRNLTGMRPPTTDPYECYNSDHAYHALARDLFELAALKGWKDHARKAARNVKAGKGILLARKKGN